MFNDTYYSICQFPVGREIGRRVHMPPSVRPHIVGSEAPSLKTVGTYRERDRSLRESARAVPDGSSPGNLRNDTGRRSTSLDRPCASRARGSRARVVGSSVVYRFGKIPEFKFCAARAEKVEM